MYTGKVGPISNVLGAPVNFFHTLRHITTYCSSMKLLLLQERSNAMSSMEKVSVICLVKFERKLQRDDDPHHNCHKASFALFWSIFRQENKGAIRDIFHCVLLFSSKWSHFWLERPKSKNHEAPIWQMPNLSLSLSSAWHSSEMLITKLPSSCGNFTRGYYHTNHLRKTAAARVY